MPLEQIPESQDEAMTAIPIIAEAPASGHVSDPLAEFREQGA